MKQEPCGAFSFIYSPSDVLSLLQFRTVTVFKTHHSPTRQSIPEQKARNDRSGFPASAADARRRNRALALEDGQGGRRCRYTSDHHGRDDDEVYFGPRGERRRRRAALAERSCVGQGCFEFCYKAQRRRRGRRRADRGDHGQLSLAGDRVSDASGYVLWRAPDPSFCCMFVVVWIVASFEVSVVDTCYANLTLQPTPAEATPPKPSALTFRHTSPTSPRLLRSQARGASTTCKLKQTQRTSLVRKSC